MEKIILTTMVTLLAFLISCEQPTSLIMPVEPEPTNPLIGTFSRNDTSFTFFGNGDFSYFDNQTGYEYNYGFWVEYEDDGLLYLEDPYEFVSVWYWYYLPPENADGNLFLMIDGGSSFVEWVRE